MRAVIVNEYGDESVLNYTGVERPVPKIVEFPFTVQAREWYASPDYAEALKLRQKALDRRLMFIEGVAPPVH